LTTEDEPRRTPLHARHVALGAKMVDFAGWDMSGPLATLAVSFSPVKGDYVGRDALLRQQAAYRLILARDYSLITG
jgi:glycine cleavage system aminomethyltransferase T